MIDLFSFGAFVFDARVLRLTHNGALVPLSRVQGRVLVTLVRAEGQPVSKDALMDAAWPNEAVVPNNLTQAITSLRKSFGRYRVAHYIETVHRHGYRFAADVTAAPRPQPSQSIESRLAPYRAFIEGRAALETLDVTAIARARTAFTEIVNSTPSSASAHIGLASACAMHFESTRTDEQPDRDALQLARRHAEQACQMNDRNGEAWATLGFILERLGRRDDALAAARLSIELEPDNWRHHLRLSAASWGEERLREARRTLEQIPGLPMAHWLAASVLVARQRLDAAEHELSLGLKQHDDDTAASRFSTVALHWLRGLIAFAKGDAPRALQEFARELQHEQCGHLYARECAANSWYAIAAVRLFEGDAGAALEAFMRVRQIAPAHPLVRAATQPATARSNTHPRAEDVIVHAIALSARGAREDAAASAKALESALAQAPAGNVGWLLSVEPTLRVWERPAWWDAPLTRIRARAS